MKKVFTLTLLIICTLTSCKKDYTCKCSDGGMPDRVFTIHDTEKKAKQKCAETIYYTGGCGLQ